MTRKLIDFWKRFVNLMGIVNSTILLTILFFCVLTPAGLFMRLLRGSFLSTEPLPDSQWLPVPDRHDPRKPF